ncbi:MAG TPA: LysE family translocator [Myxococcaceae bacterium]|jgi:threonine/homoserine/homoserine lactone efflux protein|nr:LysE family translocator [Myxococcaceae bacterium]
MDLAPWLGFLGLSTAAVLTPGPTLLAVVGHAAGTGFRATVPVVLGNALGIAVLMGISIAGVASALLRAPGLLLVLQLAGAGYLAWHGARMWSQRDTPVRPASDGTGAGPLWRGFLLVWSNPKALLFFGAVLPQFLRADRSLGVQFLVLAATFLSLELAVTTVAAAAAGRLVGANAGRAVARLRGAGGLLVATTAVFLAVTALR